MLRAGEIVNLQPKTTALLWLLLQRAGEVVTKAEILDALWPGQDAGEDALSFQISKLRQALEDNPRKPRFVVTVHRLGFRFVGPADPAAAASESVFVGRVPELARLDAAVGESAAGQPQMVFITAESGLGKTALIQRFLNGLKSTLLVGRSGCREHQHGHEPHAVLTDVLDTLLRQPPAAGCIDALKVSAPNWLLRLPGILSAQELKAVRSASAVVSEERMRREWLAALELLSGESPLVLVLEDLHWSDEATLDLLQAMIDTAPLPLLLIASYRPVEAVLSQHPVRRLKQTLTAAGKADELPLDPFTEEEVAAYLHSAKGQHDASPTVARQLFERSDGHPLYLAQLVAALGENPAAAASTVPGSLQELIALQLERLPAAQQRLLEQASVIGQEFSVALLAAVLGEPVAELESRCLELSRGAHFIADKGLAVWPDGVVAATFSFSHDLIRRVILLRLSPAERAQACARIAVRLEAAYGPRSHQVAAKLAAYFGEAGRLERSIEFHLLAGYQYLGTGALREAEAHVELAAEQVDSLSELPARRHAELALATIRVHLGINSGGFSAAELARQTARLRLLLPQVEDSALRENVLGLLWITSFFNSRHAEAMDLAQQAAELGRALPCPVLQCAGLAWRSLGAHVIGQDQLALELSTEAIALAQSHDWDAVTTMHSEPGCAAISASAHALWVLGRPDAALARAFEGVARAEMLDNPYLLCTTVGTTLGSIYLVRREAQKLLDNCREIRPLCERYEHREALAWLTKFEGLARCLLGDQARGLPLLREVIDAQRSAGALVSLLADYIYLAEQQMAAGEDAKVALGEGFELLEQTGERQWEPELWRVQGDWHRLVGDHAAEATRCYRQALALAEERGALSYALRAACALAQLDLAAGKAGVGAQALVRILAGFSEGFSTPDLVEARRLQAALGVGRR